MPRLQQLWSRCLRSNCPEFREGTFYWTCQSLCSVLTLASLLLCALVALLCQLLWLGRSEPASLADALGGIVQRVQTHCRASANSTTTDGHVLQYLGVPYGRVDRSGRFSEAALVEYRPGMALRWRGVAACPQYPWSPVPRLPTVESTSSDDCLYLNIWRPGVQNSRNVGSGGRCRSRPVVLVLHGGRFQYGGGGTYAFYDGRRAALLWDAVVVVPAYRVGAFGFLNMLVQDAPGNVGLLDQALALRWVHRYIHYFGGDNQRITILGQDAGASAIGFHLARYETPFQRAILMSGSPFSPLPRNSGERAIANGNALAEVLGCSRLDVRDAAARRQVVACLRKRSVPGTVLAADELATSNDLVVYAPSATRDYPWKLGGPTWSKARLRSVDFLVGVARDEGTLHVSEMIQVFGLAPDQTLTPRRLLSVFRVFLEAYGVQDVESVVRHYGLDRPGVYDDTLGQLFLLELARPMGDFLIYCPALFFLEEVFSVGGRAFFYEFGYSPSYRTWPSWQGVPQFVDFVFGTGLLDALDTIQPVSSNDRVVARDFASMVAAFASHGNPNVLPNTLWHRWRPSEDAALLLDYNTDGAYKEGPSAPGNASCDYWRHHFGQMYI